MKEIYLNAPVKNCATCVHNSLSKDGEQFDRCRRFGTYSDIALEYKCGLSEWRIKPPKPPKRSLRQWLYDAILA